VVGVTVVGISDVVDVGTLVAVGPSVVVSTAIEGAVVGPPVVGPLVVVMLGVLVDGSSVGIGVGGNVGE